MGKSFYDIQEKNIRKTKILIFLFIFFATFFGFLIDFFYAGFPDYSKIPFFTIFAFLLSSINSYISYNFGDKILLKTIGVRKLNLNDLKEKMLLNVVEEMKIASGLPMPKVYILDTDIPNAFATGKNPENSSIVVTKGLLNLLNREELQGVIGHELAHIRNRDILVMTVAATLVGVIVLLSDLANRFLRYQFFTDSRTSKRRETRSRIGLKGGTITLILLILLLILSILGPLFARLVFFSISRSREYLADASSAELTRNPVSLAKALEKIASLQNPFQWKMKGVSHMCIVNPLKSKFGEMENFFADLMSTHPPIEKRIKILKEMAGVF
ncbi:MAG: M48 family metallopeptidase [candidate division WOR-3 bacterium]